MTSTGEYFKTVDEWNDDVHRYRVIAPACDDWLERLADLYRELRTYSHVPISDLGLAGIEDFDVRQLAALLVETQVPTRHDGTGGPKHLAVERSDIGELALALVGERHHGYSYGYRSIRDRELVKLPGRGIDQIGVVEGTLGDGSKVLVLSLGEAKVSVDKESPPAVVDKSADCLRSQHLAHLSDLGSSVQKVLAAAKASVDPLTAKSLYAAAML